MFGHEIDGLDTLAFEQAAADTELGHACKDVEQGLLVECGEGVLRGFAEEDLTGLLCGFEVFASMYHDGHLFGQTALQLATTRVFAVTCDDVVDLILLQAGEDLDVAFSILVSYVEPELVEAVGRCVTLVEPDVALLGLAELAAVALGDEGAGEGVCLAAAHSPDELSAGGDVAPLVGTAHLQLAALVRVQVVEVVALEQLVGEFGEREAVACLAVQTLLHAVLGHHVVDGDVLAYVACEGKEGEVLHPVVVVDQFGTVGGIAIEVEEACQLCFDTCHVVCQRSFVEQVALLALAGWIADHAGGTSDEGEGLVAATLQVAQHHHAAQVADMEAVGCGVDAEISCYLFFCEEFLSARHHLVDHAAPCKFFYEIHL